MADLIATINELRNLATTHAEKLSPGAAKLHGTQHAGPATTGGPAGVVDLPARRAALSAVAQALGLPAGSGEDACLAAIQRTRAEAAEQERARVAGIMRLPEVVGREQAAVALATAPGVTAEATRGILASLPKGAAAKPRCWVLCRSLKPAPAAPSKS